MDLTNLCTLACFIWIGILIAGMNGQPRDMDVNLVLSTPIKEGDDLKMKCLFPVPSNTSVSSVKWYKGRREIFRYEHKPTPKKKSFTLGNNLIIDEGNSDMQTLKLKSVPAYMTGEMSCEVTLEDPKAKAVITRRNLLVVIPPREKPDMNVALQKFMVGTNVHQKILANCTSAPSKPASNLTFHMNELPILHNSPGVAIRQTQPDSTYMDYNNNSLEIRRIELEVFLQDQFINGKVRLKCVSELFNVHNITSDEFVGDQIRPIPQQNPQYSGSLYGRAGRGSATGTINPSWTLINSLVGKLVLTITTLTFCYY